MFLEILELLFFVNFEETFFTFQTFYISTRILWNQRKQHGDKAFFDVKKNRSVESQNSSLFPFRNHKSHLLSGSEYSPLPTFHLSTISL